MSGLNVEALELNEQAQEFDRNSKESPKDSSCATCCHEKTCGYSSLATLGYRTKSSYGLCCLGMRSMDRWGNSRPFYEKKGKSK